MEDSRQVKLEGLPKLSATEIISKSFDIYLKNFAGFIAPFIVVSLISGAITGLLAYYSNISYYHPTPPIILSPDIALFMLLSIGAFFITLFLNLIASGIIVKMSSDAYLNQPVDLKKSYSLAASMLGTLFIASLLFSLLVFIGTILLVIPGIIFALWFSTYLQQVILEKSTAASSISQSKELVDGHLGHTFITLLLIVIVIGVLSGIVSLIIDTAILGISLTLAHNLPLTILVTIIRSVAASIFWPLWGIGLTILYYDIKNRKNLLKTVEDFTDKPSGRPPFKAAVQQARSEKAVRPHCLSRVEKGVFCSNCGAYIGDEV